MGVWGVKKSREEVDQGLGMGEAWGLEWEKLWEGGGSLVARNGNVEGWGCGKSWG